jgi:cytoskeletal protein RodZ
MPQPNMPDAGDNDERGGPMGNLVLLLIVAALIGLGVWLLDAMMAQRAIDDCAAQGRRNCAALDLPAR